MTYRSSARLSNMNARVDLLLDEVLKLPPEERSAVAMALIEALQSEDGNERELTFQQKRKPQWKGR